MSIQTHDYSVLVGPESATVTFQGSLRLNAAPEYQPISDLLDQAAAKLLEAGASTLTLDLRELKFLNSSGINLLYQFVLRTKKQAKLQLTVIGNEANAWQPKSLSNMVKFMPSLNLQMQ